MNKNKNDNIVGIDGNNDNNNIQKQQVIKIKGAINPSILDKTEISCSSQSNTVPLAADIESKRLLVLADYSPCNLVGLSATFDIDGSSLTNRTSNNATQIAQPNSDIEHLKLVLLNIDTITGKHKTAFVDMSQIKQVSNGVITVNFENMPTGVDPATGKVVVLDTINGLALFNEAIDKPIDFAVGNQLTVNSTFS